MKFLAKYKNILLAVLAAVAVFIFLPKIAALAEDDREIYPEATVYAFVNIRKGPGTNYDVIIQTVNDTKVAIIGEDKDKDGVVWYNIRFYYNGNLYEGWSYGPYTVKTGAVITATATPTPEATATPTPTPTEAVTPTPQVTSTPTPFVSPTPVIDENSKIYKNFWKGIVAVLVIMVIIIIIIFVYNKVTYSRNKNSEMNKKMKYLKGVEPDSGEGEPQEVTTAKRPTVRVVPEETEAPAESSQPTVFDEVKTLRARLDQLKQHDIIVHKFFGKGEVYDNSDVKLMEVRFGMDVRYLNKDSIAAKKLVTFDDDGTLPTKRKL